MNWDKLKCWLGNHDYRYEEHIFRYRTCARCKLTQAYDWWLDEWVNWGWRIR